MASRIQLRRDIAANWVSSNPILAQGEIGLETDTLKIKVGDGLTAWNSLPYWIDLNHEQNTDTILAEGTANEVTAAAIRSHIDSSANPHSVTKAQVGLSNVDNVSAADLRDRGTHTGSQAISTIAGLQDALDSKVDETITVSAGTGLSGGGALSANVTISHGDTSSVTNLTADTRTYVTALTFDEFGHVTGYSVGSESVTDTDTTYAIKASSQSGGAGLDLDAGGDGSGTDTVVFIGSGATAVAYTDANTITISSTDTDTTYDAGNGISLTGTTFTVAAGTGLTQEAGGLAHDNTSDVANLSSDNSAGTVIQDIALTFDEFGHVTAATANTVNLDDRYYTETEADNKFVDVNGDTLTGFLTLHADPTNALHAATKQYVDEVAEGLQAKPATEIATTTNLNATYDNGTNGVGATLTATSNGAFPEIDGVTLSSTAFGENGVLVKNQTNAEENGRYNLTQVGDASNPWILTRCALCDEADEIPGTYTFVKQGTLYAGTGWVQVVNDPSTFVVGTNDIIVTQFSGAGTYTAGNGLVLNGTQFSHADTSSQESVNNSNNTFIQGIDLDGFGHVTGITSGSVTINDGTLTVNTSGVGLSGTGTFSANQSTNNTITITSNATSNNTASTIVARDASGDFTANVITATDFNSTSDERFKENIRTIANPLDLVNQLRGVKFTWKDNGEQAIGLIAQEAEKILPEVVKDADDRKTVSYGNIVGLLIEAIKEQQKQIEELKQILNK